MPYSKDPSPRFREIRSLILTLINKIKITEIRILFDELYDSLSTGDPLAISNAANHLLKAIDEHIEKMIAQKAEGFHPNKLLALFILRFSLASWYQGFKIPLQQTAMRDLLARDKNILNTIETGLPDISHDPHHMSHALTLVIHIRHLFTMLEESSDLRALELLHYYICNLKEAFDNAGQPDKAQLFFAYCEQQKKIWEKKNPIHILLTTINSLFTARDKDNVMTLFNITTTRLGNETSETNLRKTLVALCSFLPEKNSQTKTFALRIADLGNVLGKALLEFDNVFLLQDNQTDLAVGYSQIAVYWHAMHLLAERFTAAQQNLSIILGIFHYTIQVIHQIGHEAPLLTEETIRSIPTEVMPRMTNNALRFNAIGFLCGASQRFDSLNELIPSSGQILTLYQQIYYTRWDLIAPKPKELGQRFGFSSNRQMRFQVMCVLWLIYYAHWFKNLFIPTLWQSEKHISDFSSLLLFNIYIPLCILTVGAIMTGVFLMSRRDRDPPRTPAQIHSAILTSLQEKFSSWGIPFPPMEAPTEPRIPLVNVRHLLTAIETHMLKTLHDGLIKPKAPAAAPPLAPQFRI